MKFYRVTIERIGDLDWLENSVLECITYCCIPSSFRYDYRNKALGLMEE